MRKLSVGIVGCGVGGCTAALMLARQGHAVTLFEQTPRVGPVGAGVLLQASGQRILRSLGLLDAVIAGAEQIDELIAFTHHGRLLSRLRFADAPGHHFAFGLQRGELFAILHAAVVESGVCLRLNETIAKVAADGQSLINAAGSIVGEFDLIVAADGTRSRLRESCRMRSLKHSYSPAALWAIGPLDTVQRRLLQRTRHTQKLCGLLPTGRGRTSFFWGLERDDWPALRTSPFEDWQREVIALMPEAEPLVRTFRSFDALVFTTYRIVWMPRVVCGRVAFLGDAAHSSSPLLGHGINLAMVDARDLADAVASESSVTSALNRYDIRQRIRNTYYSALSAALTPTFQGRSSLIGIARDLALPQLQRVSPLKRIMLRTLSGI